MINLIEHQNVEVKWQENNKRTQDIEVECCLISLSINMLKSKCWLNSLSIKNGTSPTCWQILFLSRASRSHADTGFAEYYVAAHLVAKQY